MSGTVGKSLRLESVKINVDNVAFNKMTGGVQYQTHVQSIGWQNSVSDNALSGTIAESACRSNQNQLNGYISGKL